MKHLATLIQDIKMAMFTTADAGGSLRSRPMATQQQEFDGDLWFFTQASSPKVAEAESHPQVNLSYADPGATKYVSISGTAELVRDAAKNKELWNPIYKAWFPKGLEDPELALLKVSVESAEYWDSPSSKMVQLAGFIKAVATGKPYKAGPEEHGKVALK